MCWSGERAGAHHTHTHRPTHTHTTPTYTPHTHTHTHTQYPEVREPGKFPLLIIIRGERYNIVTTAFVFRSKGKEDRITAWFAIILPAS